MPITCMVIFGAPFVLRRRQQLLVIRRIRHRVFDDQAVADGVDHLRRVEERDVERRLVALGRGPAARPDRSPSTIDCVTEAPVNCLKARRDNLAVGLVPGAGEGRGDQRLRLRQKRGAARPSARTEVPMPLIRLRLVVRNVMEGLACKGGGSGGWKKRGMSREKSA